MKPLVWLGMGYIWLGQRMPERIPWRLVSSILAALLGWIASDVMHGGRICDW
jgi:hypothetical protein